MKKKLKRLAPNQITELSQCEIFVFGSNLEGQHMGGAARYAYDHFGAEWGNGVGPQGRCYAIPTMHGTLSDIKPYVDDFIEYARQHPMNRFLLTKIGCGIAGFKDKDMAPLFAEAMKNARASLVSAPYSICLSRMMTAIWSMKKVQNLLTSMARTRNRLSTAWKWQSTRPVSSRTIGNMSS